MVHPYLKEVGDRLVEGGGGWRREEGRCELALHPREARYREGEASTHVQQRGLLRIHR